jgi:hypothetical protein
MEIGVIPVRDGGQDQPVEVGDGVVEIVRGLGGPFGQLGFEPARFYPGKNRELVEPFEIVGDPVDDRVPVAPEFFGRDVPNPGPVVRPCGILGVGDVS